MADRILAGALLLVVIGYLVVAFSVIRAPFQYDPLGPESWPRILGVAAALCCAWIAWRPDVARLDVTRRTLGRLAFVVGLLALYAWGYEKAGFVIATALFCFALAWFLGATPARAALFGAVTGVVGYGVGTWALDLNMPEGLLDGIL